MKADFSIMMLCEVLGVSRSGYHAWCGGSRDLRSSRDAHLRRRIDAAFTDSRQTYGYPRMTLELRAQGERVGKARVARLMRSAGWQGRHRKAFRPCTTQSNHSGPIAPNRLGKLDTITALNQVWQADITYVKTDEGWVYLAMVIDAHSRRIIGWAFSTSLHTEFVVDALLMAVKKRGGSLAEQLLFHSDRGVQYTSERFRSELASNAILASMSRRGNCYDNAKAEAFSPPLKSSSFIALSSTHAPGLAAPSLSGSKPSTIYVAVIPPSEASPRLTLKTN